MVTSKHILLWGLFLLASFAFSFIFVFVKSIGVKPYYSLGFLSNESFSDKMKAVKRSSFRRIKNNESANGYLLVIATTMIDTIEPIKIELQRTMLRNWSLMKPTVNLIVFTDSEYWKKRCEEVGVTTSDSFMSNPNETPYLASMTEWIQNHYESRFYGYVNGDILVHNSIITILEDLWNSRSSLFPSSHILIVGRRYNAYVTTGFSSFLTTILDMNSYIDNCTYLNEQFIPVAQDYFIFTENTFRRNNILPVVIGRNDYDNYLVTICKQDENCAVIDASQSITALHMSDADGDFAGTKRKPDSDWNTLMVGEQKQFNSVHFADWRHYRTIDSALFLTRNKYFDDAFSDGQISFLKKYMNKIRPCMFFGDGLAGMSINNKNRGDSSLLADPLLAVYSDKWFFSNSNLVITHSPNAIFEDVRIPSVWEREKTGTCSRYADYIRYYSGAIDDVAVRRERKCPGCPIFDKKDNTIIVAGDCRFHVLQEISCYSMQCYDVM